MILKLSATKLSTQISDGGYDNYFFYGGSGAKGGGAGQNDTFAPPPLENIEGVALAPMSPPLP